jgi:Rha family phage regulatory protein
MPTDNTPEPVVHVKNGQPYANSRDVATFFGKRHDNVMRAVDALDCSPEFHHLNFEEVTVTRYRPDGSGLPTRTLDMTKDGFAFLVMGFTGPKAGRFKEAYIERFNMMETELRQKQPQVPQTYAQALRAAADAEEQKQIAQQEATEQG